MNEYSEANIAFHQAIIRLGGCKLIEDMTKNLFIHVRAIRRATISQDNRADRSMAEHLAIIEALIRQAPPGGCRSWHFAPVVRRARSRARWRWRKARGWRQSRHSCRSPACR